MSRRAVRTALASFGAVVAVGVVAAAVTIVPSSAQDTGDTVVEVSRKATISGRCTTDAEGYCPIKHPLQEVPVAITLTAKVNRGWKAFSFQVVNGSETATTFQARAIFHDGTPKKSTYVDYTAILVGKQPTLPPTTTPTETTEPTTTEPPVTTTTVAPTTTTAPPPPPPADYAVCGTEGLKGPATPPAGAVIVPAGDNSGVDFRKPNTTYYFESGTHTLGTGEFDQISPADGATFVGAPGAVIDGKGVNRYLFTGHAVNVTVKYLTVTGFAPPIQEGVVNHDGGDGWVMEHLYLHNNDGSAVMFGSDNILRDSCLTNNGQYGWNSIGQSVNIVMERNEISYNNTGNWEQLRPGCGCSGGGKFWDVSHVIVRHNWVHHNHGAGVWADQNNFDFLIEGNLIEDNEDQAIFYETSYNAVIKDNVLRRNSYKIGKTFAGRGDNFPIGTIYLSEAGYDPRLPAPGGATAFIVENNILEDNWGGISAWENADRYCNSPANTSTGYCTVKTFDTSPTWYRTADCVQPGIAEEPLYSDCRWSTKNLLIRGNTFKVNPASIDNCDPKYCATQAVFSNYGTVPDWSPYKGRVIQDAITFKQNNKWADNTYVGPWKFVGWEPGNYLTWDQWRSGQYNQDAGSTLN